MIFTLVLLTSGLSLIVHLGLQEYVVKAMGLPLNYYIAMTASLIIIRIALWLYRFVPMFKRLFLRTENLLNRYESRIDSQSIAKNNAFGNSKRRYTTSTKSASSGVSDNKPLSSVDKLYKFASYIKYDVRRQCNFVIAEFRPMFEGLKRFYNNSINISLYVMDMVNSSIINIFSWSDGYRKVSERKSWIKDNEFSKYVAIVSWITDSKELKPSYNLLIARIRKLVKSNSSTWAFAYYKEVMRLTVRALAGTPELVSFDNPIRVGRDLYGLPLNIPLYLRVELRKYIDHANGKSPFSAVPYIVTGHLTDAAVAAFAAQQEMGPPFNKKNIVGILTMLSIYRVFKTKVKPSFSTITDPFTGFVRSIPNSLIVKALKEIYPRGISLSIGKFSPFISQSAGPNGKLALWSAGIDALAFLHSPKTMVCLIRWMYSQKAYFYICWFLIINIIFGPIYLFAYGFFNVVLMRVSRLISGVLDWFGKTTGLSDSLGQRFSHSFFYFFYHFFQYIRIHIGSGRGSNDSLTLGKLGVVYDQAGKARVVAATNWWIQSSLSGLHQSIFKMLRNVPFDGTFDQDACFERFVSKVYNNSVMSGFDLSAATDRLPIELQQHVLDACGVNGQLWRDLLDISWWAPLNEDSPFIRYSVGQPMGALSSWAMLALTHHVIVNVAKIESGIYGDVNYAVLGDDFVINNEIVASKYLDIMSALGLEIKLSKSVISNRFTEFAKKLKGPQVDFTPIGPGAILSACRSGYMIPAVFMSAIGSVITSPQEVLDLVNKVPSGIVARQDLGNFMALVLWQMFNAKGSMTRYVNRVGSDVSSLLTLNSNIWLDTASSIYIHIFDSMTNLYTKDMRTQIAASHLPMVNIIYNVVPLLVSNSFTLRVLETLMKPFNPGFWIYLKDAFIAPIKLDETWTKTFTDLPYDLTYDDSPNAYWANIIFMMESDRRASLLELKFTKSEAKATGKYYNDLVKDMKRRFEKSLKYEYHVNWYEVGY